MLNESDMTKFKREEGQQTLISCTNVRRVEFLNTCKENTSRILQDTTLQTLNDYDELGKQIE